MAFEERAPNALDEVFCVSLACFMLVSGFEDDAVWSAAEFCRDRGASMLPGSILYWLRSWSLLA
jgi:hypothetical protein